MSNDLQLLLGCFGRIEDGFVSCRGCENNILSVNEHLDKYNEMMDYFDTCSLFDKPMFEYNAIRHFVNNMQSRFDQVAIGRPLWMPNKMRSIEKFVLDHRYCGLYIKLSLNNDIVPITQIEDKAIKIKAKPPLVEAPRANLKLRPRSILMAKERNGT